ncbi:phorbol-12-myristate-13-acetate-induced protein 1 [Rhinatrema bivittatum]|uniref:phorbol-12-myristate-13-acetate-induced protein 1 n=1 Tax=Rhinatrema bivittatum TaxID=194408 RepID=UPI001128F3C6|nr:phorbol-12-myristate-13-acetate-induced protein 1 [Rhinatrema bivittatum]
MVFRRYQELLTRILGSFLLTLNSEEAEKTIMISGRKRRKRSRRQPMPAPTGGEVLAGHRLPCQNQAKPAGEGWLKDQQEAIIESASQLRKIGDRCDLKQKILNVVSKLLCPGT